MENFHIDENIKKAETLPATFYRSDEVFELLKKRVFKRSFQWFCIFSYEKRFFKVSLNKQKGFDIRFLRQEVIDGAKPLK